MLIYDISAILHHDNGIARIKTKVLQQKEDLVEGLIVGIKAITDAENCPKSAIKKISISLRK